MKGNAMNIKIKRTKEKKRKLKSSPANIIKNYITVSLCDVGRRGIPCVKIKRIYDGKEYYLSIVAISGIDNFHYTDFDRETAFRNFAHASAALELPHKYIFTDLRPNFRSQKEYLKYKRSKTDGFSAVMLDMRRAELEYFEQNHYDRMAYLVVYADEIGKLEDALDMYLSNMTDVSAAVCSTADILRVLHKVMTFDTETERDDTDVEHINEPDSYIFPKHVHFSQQGWNVNGRYVTSLVVHDYPAYLSDLTFASYVNQSRDISVMIDSIKRDKAGVSAEIKRSLDELNSRGVIKQNVSDVMDTATEFEKVQDLYNSIANGNEQVYSVTLRFIITDDTSAEQLQKKTDKLIHQLENSGIRSFTPYNQMIDEYISLCLPADKAKNPFPLYDTFARQYPFYYQQQIDKTGMYFGRTDTNGLVVLDTFTKDKTRSSFDLLALGVKGGGKSVTLKAMLQDRLILGDRVMVLDIEDEYSTIAAVYGGQVIRMTKNSIINPLQIRVTIDAEAENNDENITEKMTEEEARETNFQSEISRINTFMSQVYPEFTADEEMKFNELLSRAYEEKNITNKTDLTQLAPTDFPIFSDILAACEENYINAETVHDKELCERLRGRLKRLSKGGVYEIFDNYTNVDIDNKGVIIFNVKAISELDEKIYNAQLFNILSLMWAEICRNVTYNRNIINPFDRRRVICLIDEAHRFISESNPQCTFFIDKLLRRSRKYFAGLWFATQSILEFFPQGIGGSEVTNKIKAIFQLVQYKVLLKQDSAAIEQLHIAFPQFTESELHSTTDFYPGEMLLAIDSSRMKIHCTRRATDADLLYMGTSEDVSRIFNRLFNAAYISSNNDEKYTESDYGLMLCTNEKTYENFVIVFAEYTFEQLGIPQGANAVIDNIVKKAVVGLARSLMDKAEAFGR